MSKGGIIRSYTLTYGSTDTINATKKRLEECVRLSLIKEAVDNVGGWSLHLSVSWSKYCIEQPLEYSDSL